MGPSPKNKRQSRRWSPTWRCTPTSLSRFQYFYKCFKRQCCLKRRYEVFNHVFSSVITQGKMEFVANLFHIQNLNFRSLKWSLHCFWDPGAIEQVIWYKNVDTKILVDKCIFPGRLWRKFYRYYQCYLWLCIRSFDYTFEFSLWGKYWTKAIDIGQVERCW